jgi:hypothetical protein
MNRDFFAVRRPLVVARERFPSRCLHPIGWYKAGKGMGQLQGPSKKFFSPPGIVRSVDIVDMGSGRSPQVRYGPGCSCYAQRRRWPSRCPQTKRLAARGRRHRDRGLIDIRQHGVDSRGLAVVGEGWVCCRKRRTMHTALGGWQGSSERGPGTSGVPLRVRRWSARGESRIRKG